MVDAAELLRLAERAEAEGDATLSDDVWAQALGWTKPAHKGCYWRGPKGEARMSCPRLDRSIDAQEAALPGRIVATTTLIRGDGTEFHTAKMDTEEVGIGSSEKLGRLAARLRAMAAQKENADGQ